MSSQLPNFVTWFPDPFAQATDAFQIPWSNVMGYCFPPIFTDLPLSGKDKEGSGHNGSDSTNLACTGMVPSPPGDVLQVSHSTSSTEGSFTLSQPTATPSDSAGPPAISGLDGYRQTCLQVVFQRTLQICSAPIRGEKALQGLTKAPGNSGVAGVVNRRLIHFAPLDLYS